MFDIRIENAFDFRSAEYRLLFESSHATAFQHHLWLSALYERLAPALNAEPLVVVARRAEDGRLAMVLPLMRRRHAGIRLVEFADLGVSDYADVVCESDETFERLATAPGTQEKIRSLLKPFDIVRIKKVRADGRRIERLFAGASSEPMDVSAHATPLFEPYSAWRAATIPKSYATELARQRRQMERRGDFTFEPVREPPEIASLLRDLRDYRGQRYPGDVLGQQHYFDFYLDVALAGAPTGFVRLYRIALDGRSLGGTLGLSCRQRFVGLILGFEHVTYRSQSLGTLTIEDTARDCIATQHSVFDFSIGEENYKKLFSAEPTSLRMVSANGTGLGAVATRLRRKFPGEPQRGSPLPADRRPLSRAER